MDYKNEEVLKSIVSAGVIPKIEDIISYFKAGGYEDVYSAVYSISEVINTYFDLFRTGNKIEIPDPEPQPLVVTVDTEEKPKRGRPRKATVNDLVRLAHSEKYMNKPSTSEKEG